jgi:hypothetical protein
MTGMTKQCEKCKIDYPWHLVQTMATSVGNFKVCGICGLEIKNKIHGTRDKKFDGPIAEIMREQAIEYRKEIGYKDEENKIR